MPELKGKIIHIGDVQQFDSGFYKQQVVIETDDRYPQTVPVDFKKERCDLLNGLGVGNEVTIHINIEGREWNGRYFADLSGWKVDRHESQNAAEGVQDAADGVCTPEGDTSPAQTEIEDEVPF